MYVLDTTHDILSQLSGISHLHDRGIIHRDIKPANILLVPIHSPSTSTPTPYNITITDFGLSHNHPDDGPIPSLFPRQQSCVGSCLGLGSHKRFTVPLSTVSGGTAGFMAPEFYDIQIRRRTSGFGLGKMCSVEVLELEESPGYDHTVDYWALGVTMYLVMTGRVSGSCLLFHAEASKYSETDISIVHARCRSVDQTTDLYSRVWSRTAMIR